MNTITRFVAFGLLLSACESTVTGNEGNFQFSYPADDDIFDFNKPIAVGARLDVTVEDAGDSTAIQLTEASSDDPAMEVVDFSGNVMTLEAVADGNVLISVKGSKDGGDELTDSVNMLARVPDNHGLRHTCGADGATAYLANTSPYVPFDFTMENSQSVIGYGYYPVQFTGEVSLDVAHQGHQYMRLDIRGVGSHVLTSDLDGTTLDLTTVAETDIDGAEEPIAFVLEDIDVGDRNAFYVRPMVGNRVVCQAITNMVVESTTPGICTVTNAASIAGDSTDAGKESGWFEIEGVAAGSCEYTVSYPDAGSAAVFSFSYPIEP